MRPNVELPGEPKGSPMERSGMKVECRVRAQGEQIEVRYTTYNNSDFHRSEFFQTRAEAERVRNGLLRLKHVSSAEIIERSNVAVSSGDAVKREQTEDGRPSSA